MPNIQLSVKFKTDKLSASVKFDAIQTDFIRPDRQAIAIGRNHLATVLIVRGGTPSWVIFTGAMVPSALNFRRSMQV